MDPPEALFPCRPGPGATVMWVVGSQQPAPLGAAVHAPGLAAAVVRSAVLLWNQRASDTVPGHGLHAVGGEKSSRATDPQIQWQPGKPKCSSVPAADGSPELAGLRRNPAQASSSAGAGAAVLGADLQEWPGSQAGPHREWLPAAPWSEACPGLAGSGSCDQWLQLEALGEWPSLVTKHMSSRHPVTTSWHGGVGRKSMPRRRTMIAHPLRLRLPRGSRAPGGMNRAIDQWR